MKKVLSYEIIMLTLTFVVLSLLGFSCVSVAQDPTLCNKWFYKVSALEVCKVAALEDLAGKK